METHELIQQIKAEIREEFDSKYVKAETCADIQKGVAERLSDGDAQFKVINTKLSLITWGIGIIASGVIVFIVERIMNML